MVRFRGRIQIRGINPYILVKAEIARRLRSDWRGPLPVSVRINGQPRKPWLINMMPAGNGSFYLYLRDTVRHASGAEVGDLVIVDLSFDRAYRGGPAHPVPGWFRNSLGTTEGVRIRVLVRKKIENTCSEQWSQAD